MGRAREGNRSLAQKVAHLPSFLFVVVVGMVIAGIAIPFMFVRVPAGASVLLLAFPLPAAGLALLWRDWMVKRGSR